MEGIAPQDCGDGFRSPSCWKRIFKVFKANKSGMEGIEPPVTVPKTVVLPLHHTPLSKFLVILNEVKNLYTFIRFFVTLFLRMTINIYFTITLIIPFSSVLNTSSFHSLGISGFVLMNSINSFFTFKTSSYLLIFNHFSIGS